jgi:hypothetical protein
VKVVVREPFRECHAGKFGGPVRLPRYPTRSPSSGWRRTWSNRCTRSARHRPRPPASGLPATTRGERAGAAAAASTGPGGQGQPAFGVILSGQRDRTGLVVGPGQWVFPDWIPVPVYRAGVTHEIGAGRAFTGSKGNPRVRGMWSSTPLGEYVKKLVAQRVLHYADVELEASVDDAGARVYRVVSAVFTLPADPPPSVPSVGDAEAALLANRSDSMAFISSQSACPSETYKA